MTSNSANMTVAEKLAQRLKESDLGALLSMEDVDQLASEAIKAAFFTERADPNRYNSNRLPPLIVELAHNAFRDEMQARAKLVLDKLMLDADFVNALAESAQAAVPAIMNDAVRYGLQSQIATIMQSNVEAMAHNVAQVIRNKGIL